jgi:pilus assembly protein Flp/PilA
MILNGCCEWRLRCLVRNSGKTLPVAHLKLGEEKMKNLLNRLWKEEEGQDLTEYALLMVLIALVAIASMKTLGTTVSNVFSNAAANLTSAS